MASRAVRLNLGPLGVEAMTTSPQLDYVKREIDREIDMYARRKHYNRRAAFAFTVVPASLAAFATVAIGAADKLKIDWLPLLAMVATGIASILGAWEALQPEAVASEQPRPNGPIRGEVRHRVSGTRPIETDFRRRGQ